MSFDVLNLSDYFTDFPLLDFDDIAYDVFKLKSRVIYNPHEDLKKAQRYLKNRLNWEYPLNMTTVECAKIHSGKKWILKMDIKDFYESVCLDDIQKVLNKILPCKVPLLDEYLIGLVTIGGILPTGAPTSAHIANACFLPSDKRIKEYCSWHGVQYSRYMDDLTFSCDNKNVLNSVEYFVTDIVQFSGFRVNEKKTRFISANKQQNILGLVVNNEVRIPKKLRRRIRAMLHHYAMWQGRICPRDDKYSFFGEEKEVQLKGYMNYIKSVDPKTYKKLVEYSKKI